MTNPWFIERLAQLRDQQLRSEVQRRSSRVRRPRRKVLRRSPQFPGTRSLVLVREPQAGGPAPQPSL